MIGFPQQHLEEGEEPQDYITIRSPDTIFVLAYAIIMLNTDAHSTKIKEDKKMTLKQFLSNTKSLNDLDGTLPAFYRKEIFYTIRYDEIKLFDDEVPNDVNEGGYWDVVLQKMQDSEEYDELNELFPVAGSLERDMFQVIYDTKLLRILAKAFVAVGDVDYGALSAMDGFVDTFNIACYFGMHDIQRTIFNTITLFLRPSVSPRNQLVIKSIVNCLNNATNFDDEWSSLVPVFFRMWQLRLLPHDMVEFDDFMGSDGKMLTTQCDFSELRLQLANTAATGRFDIQVKEGPENQPQTMPKTGGIFGMFFSRVEEETTGGTDSHEYIALPRVLEDLASQDNRSDGGQAETRRIPVHTDDPMVAFQALLSIVHQSKAKETWQGAKTPPENLASLVKALISLATPPGWEGQEASQPDHRWGQPFEIHRMRMQPVFCLEWLVVIAFLRDARFDVAWPLISGHFASLLNYICKTDRPPVDPAFAERVLVSVLRFCIRLQERPDCGESLMMFLNQIYKLPQEEFSMHSERIVCGLLVFIHEQNSIPTDHYGIILALLTRVATENNGNMSIGCAGSVVDCLKDLVMRGDINAAALMEHGESYLDLLAMFALQYYPPNAIKRDNSTRSSTTKEIQEPPNVVAFNVLIGLHNEIAKVDPCNAF